MNSNTAVDLTAYIPELEKAFPSLKWEVVKDWDRENSGYVRVERIRTSFLLGFLDIYVQYHHTTNEPDVWWPVYQCNAAGVLRLRGYCVKFSAGPVVAVRCWIDASHKSLNEYSAALDAMKKGVEVKE